MIVPLFAKAVWIRYAVYSLLLLLVVCFSSPLSYLLCNVGRELKMGIGDIDRLQIN